MMTDSIRQKYVVILDRKRRGRSSILADRIQSLTGVEVVSQSTSFIDFLAEAEVENSDELINLLEDFGAELHLSPGAALMDPIKPKNIP